MVVENVSVKILTSKAESLTGDWKINLQEIHGIAWKYYAWKE